MKLAYKERMLVRKLPYILVRHELKSKYFLFPGVSRVLG